MLVLSRKMQEKTVIGGNVIVTVLDINGGRVRLGFEAPHDVSVYRHEVFVRIQRKEAASAPADAATVPPGLPVPSDVNSMEPCMPAEAAR